MWLFTLYGFFSATRSREEPDMIQVRARARKDLEALRNACLEAGCWPDRLTPCTELFPILETKLADYQWRVILTPSEWAIIMAFVSERIDYPNFKDAVCRQDEQTDKLGILHEIWHLMHDYQGEQNELPRRCKLPSLTYTNNPRPNGSPWVDVTHQDTGEPIGPGGLFQYEAREAARRAIYRGDCNGSEWMQHTQKNHRKPNRKL